MCVRERVCVCEGESVCVRESVYNGNENLTQ